VHFVLNTGTDNDYGPGPYNITIPSGDVRVSFDISIADDTILETSEEFLLRIDPSSLPDGVTVGSESNATVIIVDNNGKCSLAVANMSCMSIANSLAITVNFSNSNYVVGENDGRVQPMLILSNPSSTDITIRVDTADREAIGETMILL